MTSKVNQRAKRKNEFSDKKNEPNLKALKKEDIIAQFTALQAKYSILELKVLDLEKKNVSLEEEKRTHKEAIDLLEETVKVLEEKTDKNKIDQKTTEMQTGISKEQAHKNTYVEIVIMQLIVYMILMTTHTVQKVLKIFAHHSLLANFVMKVLKLCKRS